MNPYRLEVTAIMSDSGKTPISKSRKRTVSQILRKSYARYCRDSATRHALRVHLRK